MKQISGLAILLILFFSCTSNKIFQENTQMSSSEKKVAKKKNVFLFAGQSNMDGRANGANLSESDLQRLKNVASRIQFYYNHQPVTPLQLTTPAKYTQRKFNLEKSFGPELFFGIELAEKYPEEEFIFIKRAKGGTSLYGCWNPYWESEKAALMRELDQPKLFEDFISYSNDVLEKYDPSEYKIVGMLWVQGEADSGVKKWGAKPAETYGENLQHLITEVRKKFNQPKLPFALFQVGHGKVVEGMEKVAGADSNVFLIPQSRNKKSPDFYEKNPPPIGHYTAKSMKRIGNEFFAVYSDILFDNE